MIELVDKDTKRYYNCIPMFKKPQQRGKCEVWYKYLEDLNWTSSNENYNVWVKKIY